MTAHTRPITRLHPAVPLFRGDLALVRVGYATEPADVLALATDGAALVRRACGETVIVPPEAAIRVLQASPERRQSRLQRLREIVALTAPDGEAAS